MSEVRRRPLLIRYCPLDFGVLHYSQVWCMWYNPDKQERKMDYALPSMKRGSGLIIRRIEGV